MGTKITGGLVSIVAAATSTTLHTLSLNKRAKIKKIRANNRTGAIVTLQIGYDTNAGAPVFTPVMPDLSLLPGENWYEEGELPVCGNTPEGFQADTTVTTGTLGNIIGQASAAAAAPADVQVQIEVEEE